MTNQQLNYKESTDNVLSHFISTIYNTHNILHSMQYYFQKLLLIKLNSFTETLISNHNA